jgi:hypothetical protein
MIGIWYTLIHDIIPTWDRLHVIRLVNDNLCLMCQVQDTLLHRLIECGEGAQHCHWTKTRLAMMLRVDPCCIPGDWLFLPQFRVWHPQKRKAILWLLAHFVKFRCQHCTTLTMQDLHDFLLRSKKKLYQARNHLRLVGNYLSVIDKYVSIH